MTPYSFSRAHACATRPCVSPLFARVASDRVNKPMPSLSEPRHRWTPVSSQGELEFRPHRLVSHATAPGPRATAVVVDADGDPPSGRTDVGVPGQSVAMGETRDGIGPALGRVVERDVSTRTAASRFTPTVLVSPGGSPLGPAALAHA